MSDNKLIKIGEVAKRANVTLRTLRYYHELGLIEPATRTEGNFRLFDESTINIVRLISNLKDLGFSLEEIKNLLECHNTDENDYKVTVQRTRKILQAEKNKVLEKLKNYEKIKQSIDCSLEIIEECIRCRTHRGGKDPCKPGCTNNNVHIKI
jgi:MerR family Zn(II)-responsive transcriptional regulator of zntA